MKNSLTMRKAIETSVAEISSFRKYTSFPKSYRKEIYDILISDYEIDVEKSVLVSYLPEGGKNLGITLIDQSGYICFFDIDPDHPEYNQVERTSIDDYEKSRDFNRLKPWHDLVLGIEIFRDQQKYIT